MSLAVSVMLPFSTTASLASASDDSPPTYTYQKPSRDGIGKVYMSREISHVMGHLGASWLERENREREERTDLLINALELQPADVVADIGAGTGYFVFRMAPQVPQGKVYAVDIQQEMLDIITARAAHSTANVEPVLGAVDSVRLPANSTDLVLLVDAYHEFSHPLEMTLSIAAALKPGGRLAIVEYRGEDRNVRIKPLHKMTEAQVIKEISAAGLDWSTTIDTLPQQHLIFFKKPGAP